MLERGSERTDDAVSERSERTDDATPEERRALFRVVRGRPSDTEIAALTVVLAAAASAAPPRPPRPQPARAARELAATGPIPRPGCARRRAPARAPGAPPSGPADPAPLIPARGGSGGSGS